MYSNGTTVEIELNDNNLHLRDSKNEKEINPYSSHVYAIVNKKKDNNDSKIAWSLQNIWPPIFFCCNYCEEKWWWNDSSGIRK